MSDQPLIPPDDRWEPLDYPGGLDDGQWRRDQWAGKEQLVCIHCGWDTLRGLEVAREHAAKCTRCHPVEEIRETQAPAVLVANKYGNIKSGGLA